MNIIFLSDHCCIRVIKEGQALGKLKGVRVHYIMKRVANTELLPMLGFCSFWEKKADLLSKLKQLSGFDLIHVHNEPSWLATVAREACPNMPIVFDAHDLNSDRYGEKTEEETSALEASDAFIVPSKHYGFHLQSFWGVKKPIQLIYSYCNEEILNWPRWQRLFGIVYQGGLSVDPERKHWRDMRHVTARIVEMGIPFYIYPAGMNHIHHYQDLGANVMPTMGYVRLMQNIGRFDWSWVAPGTVEGHPALKSAMPNKLFESIAMGVPVITTPAEAEVAEFVRNNEMGIVLSNIEELANRKVYDQHKYYRVSLSKVAPELTMESQTQSILDLYAKLGVTN